MRRGQTINVVFVYEDLFDDARYFDMLRGNNRLSTSHCLDEDGWEAFSAAQAIVAARQTKHVAGMIHGPQRGIARIPEESHLRFDS